MAKNVVLNIEIKTKGGEKSIGDLNKEIKTTLTTLGEMEEASEAISKKLREVDVGTAEYKKLRQELITVNTEIKNQELAMEALDNEQVASELKSVAGGLADMAGGFVLVGVASENIEKVVQTMAQVEGATKIVTGAIEAYQSAMKLGATFTKILAVAQGVLNAVISANPIAILVLAIVGLVAGFIALVKWVGGVSEAFEFMARVGRNILVFFGLMSSAENDLINAEIDAAKKRRELSAANSKRHKERLKQIEEAKKASLEASTEFIENLELERETLEAEGKSVAAVTLIILEEKQKQVQIIIDANNQIIAAAEERFKKEAEIRGVSEEEFIKQLKAQSVDVEELQQRANEIQQEFADDLQRSENAITKFKREENEKRVQDAKASADAELAFWEARAREAEKEFQAFLKAYEKWAANELKIARDILFGIGEEIIKVTEQIEEEIFDDIIPEGTITSLEAFFLKLRNLGRDGVAAFKLEFQTAFQSISEGFDQFSNFLIQGMGLFMQAMDQQAQRARATRETAFREESEGLKAQLANREISQTEFDQRSKILEQKKREEEKKAARKAFKRDKANNIVRAIIATASSVMQALGGMPPPASFVFAGINATLGAVQTAIIASQKFTAQRGGIVPGQGPSNVDSVPSLLAPGEAVINAQSTAAFSPLLSAINQAGGGISLAPELANAGLQAQPVFRNNEQETMVKAFVVEQDMTDKQKMARRFEDAAAFGR